MANIIKAKRSAVPGKVPATTDLALGEIGINTYDGKAYIKKDVGGVESIVALGGGAGTGDVTGPASSTDNAISRFDGASGKTIQNSSASIDDSGNLTSLTSKATGTGANTMPVGTTAQRPGTPAAGMYRLNTDTDEPEWYDATTSAWIAFRQTPTYEIDFMCAAGGGGGGNGVTGSYYGGGGGAGGLIYGTDTVTKGTAYTVVIGGGGNFGGGQATTGGSGSPSQFGSFANPSGGGWGGAGGVGGGSGGSGGGGSLNATAGGSGTSGQGYRGGNYYTSGQGAPGGGRNGAGSDTSTVANNGYTSAISGTSTTYSTGGDGSPAGNGGGANTGNGGKAGNNGYVGNAGGSGIVIIRYLGAQKGTGGTVTSSGGYTIHKFTSSGTFTA